MYYMDNPSTAKGSWQGLMATMPHVKLLVVPRPRQ